MSKNTEPGFICLSNNQEENKKAINEYGQVLDSYIGISKANQFSYDQRTFVGIDTNISARSEYNRRDYEYFRPNERIPKTPLEKISASLEAYDDYGIVRNIIDLMGDFGSQGIRITHPIPKVERFYQEWFELIKGKERSNMFLNLLYRCGNVVSRRLEGKISVSVAEEWASAEPGIPNTDRIKIEKRTVPLRYIFYTPLAIEVLGGQAASFSSKPMYALKLGTVNQSLKVTGIEQSQEIIDKIVGTLPSEVQEALKNKAKYILLNQDNVDGYHYKKNDWDNWATPMLAPVLPDLYRLEKTKLADMSALDGVISNITLWNLGKLDGVNSILPTKTAIDKLNNILTNNVSGGVMHLVWGPELSFKESQSNSFKFLGEEKYKPILDAIYSGLGIPQSLVGGGGAGMTNNYMQLKTLIERLEYGREVLISFWKKELKRVQKAMGHKKSAIIVFDDMVLSDEAAQTTLLLQMLDRNIISDESFRDKTKFNNDIETVRIKRETKKRGNGMPHKTSPFHNPVPEDEPTTNLTKTEPKGSPLDGRPKNSKDSVKRKKKRVLPKTKGSTNFVDLMLWAEESHKQVSEIVSKAVLGGLGKKNLRMLTDSEFNGLESVKFAVFSNLEPFTQVNDEKVYSILEEDMSPNSTVDSIYKSSIAIFLNKNGRQPTTDETRKIQISSYILKTNGEDDGDN